MKKLSVVFTLIIVLLLSTVFVACGGGKTNLKSIYNKDYSAVTSRTYSKEDLPELTDYVLSDENSDFIVFRKFDADSSNIVRYRVFNKKNFTMSNEIMSTTKNEYDLDFSYKYGINLADGYYEVKKIEKDSLLGTIKTEVARFNVKGEEIYNSEKAKGSIITQKNFFAYDNTICYKDENGVYVTDILQVPTYKIPSGANAEKVGNYFVDKTDGAKIVVYDKDFNMLIDWKKPSYVSSSRIFVCDEFAIVQYEIAVDSYEMKNYDLIKNDGSKYNLKTFVLNYKEKQIKEVKTEFVINSLFNVLGASHETREALSNKITNVAIIFYIKDKRIDQTNDYDYVSLKSNCTVEKSFKMVDEQTSQIPFKLENNVYIIETSNGFVFLNEKGKTIERIASSGIELFDKYLCIDKKLYDYSFNEVFDFSEYTSVSVKEDYIGLVNKDNKYFVYTKGEVKPIDGENVTFYDDYYVVKKTGGIALGTNYELCLPDGTLAFTSKNAYVLVYGNDNGSIVRTSVVTNGVSQIKFLFIKVSK